MWKIERRLGVLETLLEYQAERSGALSIFILILSDRGKRMIIRKPRYDQAKTSLEEQIIEASLQKDYRFLRVNRKAKPIWTNRVSHKTRDAIKDVKRLMRSKYGLFYDTDMTLAALVRCYVYVYKFAQECELLNEDGTFNTEAFEEIKTLAALYGLRKKKGLGSANL